MVYDEQDPPVRQQGRVLCYWRFEVEASDPEAFEHVVVPDGTISVLLAWNAAAARPMAFYAGPRRTALRVPVQRGSCFWGVRFRPGAAPVQAPVRLLEKHGLLDAVVPGAWARTCVGLTRDNGGREAFGRLEAEVDRWLESAEAPDPVVLRAVERLVASSGFARIGDVAAEVGLSARQLLRRFTRAVGLSPKEFARMRRVRWACVQAVMGEEAAGWAGVAGESGFADQAHLSREFRRVFGWTPRMMEEYLKRIDHRRVRV